MVCCNPKIAYQRRYMPIDGNLSEKNLKRLNKISFTYKEGWTQIELPCGECPQCKLAKANEWAVRIECEAKTWKHHGVFVTLTYDNEHLPMKNGKTTLIKKHIQDFKKRLRKYIATHKESRYYWNNPKSGKLEKPVRTFECGEYGTKGTRAIIGGNPHYHQIIFNWIPNDLKYDKKQSEGSEFPLYKSKTLKKLWGHGFVIIGMISYESASYVARYTMKKNGLAKIKREYYDVCEPDKETGQLVMKTKYRNVKGEVESEFISMSTGPGIGYHYYMENREKIKENNGILIKVKGNAKLKKIPRYFRKLWERLDWEDYETWKLHNRKMAEVANENTIKNYNLPDSWHYWQKEKFAKQKAIDTMNMKIKLLKRDKVLEDAA